MRRYLAARVAMLIPTVLGVVTAVFLVIHLVPGDPVEAMLGENALAAEKDALRHKLGLDRSLLAQYGSWMAGLARGDLGVSITSRRPVLDEVAARWPATAGLALAALVIAAAISLPLGIFAAARRGGPADTASWIVSLMGSAMPVFWLGPLLIIVFSIKFAWLPVSGNEGMASYVLPSVTLGVGMAALLTRMVRSSLLESISEDYIRTARARGLAEWKVYGKHALANALLPVITVMGLQFGALLSGAVLTETVFAWPGVGRLMIEAIERRDYPLVQGCVLNIALCYVLVNFMADALCARLDPRIRTEK